MRRSSARAATWTVLRLAMALATASAIVAQAAVTIGGASALGKDTATTAANFFSFFTILSNLAAVVVLTWAGLWWLARARGRATTVLEPPPLAFALAAVSTYMIVTGIVYNALLRQIALPQGSTVPWSNEVLHLIGPLFFAADLFLGPGRRALGWRAVGGIAVFPVAWVVYTLIRGPLTVDPGGRPPYWYPYPFLNPNTLPGGYGGVAVYVVIIAAAIIAIAAGVVWLSRRRGGTGIRP